MKENVRPLGRLKTPISYYGGKQSMLKHILPLIPEHTNYIEPFFGGGAVFWAKEPADVEVINDYNGMVTNFYQQLKTNFEALKVMVEATPYSRISYQKALVVYENPFLFPDDIKAWAFWIATVQGFSNKIGSWRGSGPTTKEVIMSENKKALITPEHSHRLKKVQIENVDAVYLIERHDSPETFFYLDPPYVDSMQGHYGGYTQQHFDVLLEALSKIKGKFLLSSYPNAGLDQYRERNGWHTADKNMQLSASRNKDARKTECLTANFDLKAIF